MGGFNHNLVPELYILDKDITVSSTYLADKDVDRNIRNSVKLLGSCVLHLNGIRKLNVYDQYPIDQLMDMFRGYPSNKLPKPKFSAKLEYKYVRQCANHFVNVIKIGKSACVENENRYNKVHVLSEVLDWYCCNIPDVLPYVDPALPYPIRILPMKYRNTVDIVDAMRRFYVDKYRHLAFNMFKYTSIPEWFELTESDVFKGEET